MNDYRIISAGSCLSKTIEMLLRYREKGEKVCCDYNGHTLYSDTENEDEAYK